MLTSRERVDVPGLLERLVDDLLELGVDLVLLPEVLLEALHPLEVGDDDAARVREHVGQDEDALVLEDLVGGGRGRAVCALADDLRLDLVGVLLGDHLLEPARGEDVAVEQEQLLVRDRLDVGEPLERAALLLVRDRRGDVDALRVVDAAARVGHRDHRRALLLHEERVVASRRCRSPGRRPSCPPASARAAPSRRACRRPRRGQSPRAGRATRRWSAACRSRRRAPSGPCSSSTCRRSRPSRAGSCRRPERGCPSPARSR